METLKDRLILARKSKNMKQKDVATMLNITRSCYANYEQGLREPEIDTLKKLCLIFDISADYLIGLEDERQKSLTINNNFNTNNFSHNDIDINFNIKKDGK